MSSLPWGMTGRGTPSIQNPSEFCIAWRRKPAKKRPALPISPFMLSPSGSAIVAPWRELLAADLQHILGGQDFFYLVFVKQFAFQGYFHHAAGGCQRFLGYGSGGFITDVR